jgi:hypothetical protein
MPSKIEIANRALTKVGAESIMSLTDNVKRAQIMNSMFDMIMDAELRRNRWKFSIRRDSLPALVSAPAWGYSYAYQLPADFLALVQVNDFYVRGLKQRAPWSVEGGQILTDFSAPLKIRYVAKVSSIDLLDPLFVEVLACKLALESCEALTQSAQKRQLAANEYDFAVSEAARQDAIENPPDMATTATGPSAGSVADLQSGWGLL